MSAFRRTTLIAAIVGVVCIAAGFYVGRLFSDAGYIRLVYCEDGTVESLTPVRGSGWKTTWYGTGEVLSQSELRDGKATGRTRAWSIEGRLLNESSARDATGVSAIISYYPSGQRSADGFQNAAGLPEGHHRLFDERGVVRGEIDYRAGERDGLSVHYYPSGAVQSVAEYSRGKLVGEVSYFDPQGTPISEYEVEIFDDAAFGAGGAKAVSSRPVDDDRDRAPGGGGTGRP
ncbi:MAG: hypothetical protein IT450_04665 [Phycisphaerales bacterium]|nr:hypothetical protein [Phycisphaerales bacterium]